MIVGVVAATIVYLADATLFEGLFPALLDQLALFSRVGKFTSDVLDVTGIVYYLSVAVLFNLLTVQSIEKRRWS